ncbi:hypothetical protein OPV22_019671 [Ensete ventricosum]|uniref:Uncharacterized protein n=1 Tax=Ensete ventricosum TaxID=4639 RepID=A0AAV8QN23_ENSVE|nr:hypothetical protein OPV22_019671 [Ensete ventricosum]
MAETVRRRRRVLVFDIYCTASVDIPWVDSPLYEINTECLGKASARTMFDEVVAVLAVGVAGTEHSEICTISADFALIVDFSSAWLTEHAPTGVVKLLWVNLVKDKIGALALITRPPNDEYMEQALNDGFYCLGRKNHVLLSTLPFQVINSMGPREMEKIDAFQGIVIE